MDKFDEKCDGKHSCIVHLATRNVEDSIVLIFIIFDVADTYDNHLFHIMIQNNLIYLAMTTNGFERRLAFAFLEKIRSVAQLSE